MILTLSITLSLLALLISCGGGGDDDDQTQSGPTIVDGYIYPPYHDYGRGTVNFEDMKYTRPDFDAAKRKFEEAAAHVSDGDISELTALYKEAEELYENASGMTALIGAMYAKSDNDASMLAEYESAASALSELSVSADIARTSAALCSHAEKISAEVYGGVLLERYGKFGEYSPSLKTLLYEEAELIHNYEFASSKVTLTFEEVTGTFDYIVETLMLDAIEAGAVDVSEDEDSVEIITEPNKHNEMRDALTAKGYNVVSADTELVPDLYVDLNEEQLPKFQRMIDALEDLDDVQEVYHNVNLPEEE